MWTREASLSRAGWILLLGLSLLCACVARKHDAWAHQASSFPRIEADTIHLASWCMKENEPAFTDHICSDTRLAAALHLDVGNFVCHGAVRIDRRHTLLIVETYTGACGTTYYPYLARRGVDTLTFLSMPFASALYGDGEPNRVGDDILSEEGNEVWLLDYDRDGDLDVVFSGWRHGCVAVPSLSVPGELDRDCSEAFEGPKLYRWEDGHFQESPLPDADAYLKLRLDRRERER